MHFLPFACLVTSIHIFICKYIHNCHGRGCRRRAAIFRAGLQFSAMMTERGAVQLAGLVSCHSPDLGLVKNIILISQSRAFCSDLGFIAEDHRSSASPHITSIITEMCCDAELLRFFRHCSMPLRSVPSRPCEPARINFPPRNCDL